uniref:GRAM domain-containing protein n=1 Tax=Aegilops tauschii subsp. strangulata TaxID=200361 RepID=A0A453BH78_AEGTS
TIPLQDVTDVRKAKTAAIFPNAIEIVAGAKRHFFGSFLVRDEAYRIIVDGWEQHVSDARLLIERQDAKSASSSDENGYILLEEGKESKQDEGSSPSNRSANPTAIIGGSTDCGDPDASTSKRFLKAPVDGTEDNPGSLNPFNLQPFDDDAPNVPESYTLITESKFQVCLWKFSLMSYSLMAPLAFWMISTKSVVTKNFVVPIGVCMSKEDL